MGGQALSDAFPTYTMGPFEFEGWPEFHKQWVAVRTRFLDDRIAESAASGTFKQIVNLGSGMDTRVHRLDCYKVFTNGSIEVDMAVINDNKRKVFADFLGDPKAHCEKRLVDLDFLEEEKTLATELCKDGSCFDAAAPTLFVSEGLIMYLGATGKIKLLKDVSAVAAPGSVFVLQFMDGSESGAASAAVLTKEEAIRELTSHGWENLEFSHFGDDKLNFGRFPTDRFKPKTAFSFCVCTKGK